MRMRVRLLQVVVAVALTLGLTTIVSTSAWAYTAYGSVTCTQSAGFVKFSPALSSTGTASNEHISLKAKVGLGSCATSPGSNATHVFKMTLIAHWTVTATDANRCGQATPTTGSIVISAFRVVYDGVPHNPSPTLFSNTGENWVTGASSTLTLPASGDSGSFAGTPNTIGLTLATNPCSGTVPRSNITGFTGGSLTLG